jgi:hypothetical protein
MENPLGEGDRELTDPQIGKRRRSGGDAYAAGEGCDC